MTGKGSRVEQAVRQAEAAVAIGATRVGDVSAAEFNASQAAIDELMQLVAKQDAELTALKGRRCDGCKWSTATKPSSAWSRYGSEMMQCDVQAQMRPPVFADGTGRDANWQDIIVHADHYCAAWEVRP